MILRGAFQPIEGVHFYRSRYLSRYRGLCDRALSNKLITSKQQTGFGVKFSFVKNAVMMYLMIKLYLLTDEALFEYGRAGKALYKKLHCKKLPYSGLCFQRCDVKDKM